MPKFLNALTEHRRYVGDRVRMAAFRQAIAEVVRPGSVVLDLGAGTGVLGVLACRAGARRVYAVDRGGIVGLARAVARANGCEDRITCLRGKSTEVALPEPIDVVVADQLAAFGLGAGLLESFADADRRLLAPGGVAIPRRLKLWMAPVTHPSTSSRLATWRSAPEGLDLSAALEPALNAAEVVELDAQAPASPAACVASFELPRAASEAQAIESTLTCERDGAIHGLGAWFSAELSESVTISNGPRLSARIDREQLVFPLAHEVQLRRGERLLLRTHLDPKADVFSWDLRLLDQDGARALGRGSTFGAMLLSNEDLDRGRPSRVPRLSARGSAHRDVLQLCDGVHTVEQIERILLDRHAALFADEGSAAAFVNQVLENAEDG